MTGFSITERIAEEVSMVMGEMLADIGYELGIFETEIKKMEAWLDEHTVPNATEQEDSMSVTFTPEEVGAIMSKLDDLALWDHHRHDFKTWLDAHTEKPLTFPCPGCGNRVEVRHDVLGWTGVCQGCEIKTFNYGSEAELSEALSD